MRPRGSEIGWNHEAHEKEKLFCAKNAQAAKIEIILPPTSHPAHGIFHPQIFLG
jgi:hypothetical protein